MQDLLVRMLGNVTAMQTMCLRLSQLQDAGRALQTAHVGVRTQQRLHRMPAHVDMAGQSIPQPAPVGRPRYPGPVPSSRSTRSRRPTMARAKLRVKSAGVWTLKLNRPRPDTWARPVTPW